MRVCVWGVKRQFLLRPFLSCRFLYTPVKLQVLLLKLLLINYLVNVFSTYHLQQEDMIFFNQLNYRHISTLRCQHTHTKTRLPAVHPLRITSLHNTVSFFSQLIKPEENWWTWDMVHIKTYFINHWGEFYEEVFGLGELWHHNEPMPGSIFFLFLWFKLNSRLKVWRCYSDRDGSETNKQTPGKWLCTQVPLGRTFWQLIENAVIVIENTIVPVQSSLQACNSSLIHVWETY